MGGLYQYEMPSIPSRETDILFYDLPKKDQMWKTPRIFHSLKHLSQKEKVEHIEKHRYRWENGVWFFNNGEPTYITGMHYDFMALCDFEDFGGKPEYFEQQRLDFYFRDLVRKDPNCYGSVILKCRRCGMTAEEMCQAVYTLLEDFNQKIGLQSNELQKKCLPELMHPIINMYIKRPKWMRESFYAPNNKKPVNSLKLISSVIDDNQDQENDDTSGWLGGNIIPYPTVASAMDGSKKKYIIMDEVWKWKEASPSDTLFINKKCVVQYGIKGKIGMLSTMGDSDSLAMAIKEGCEIWGQSNPKVRDPNGRTTSGLYKWFVSGIHSADIPAEVRNIQYGQVDEARCLEFIWNEVNKHAKNSKNYVFELRRLPPEEKYALMAANDQTYFDVLRFEARLKFLYDLPKDKKPYVRGKFVDAPSGNVYFEADESGPWLVALHPYFSTERNIDTRNRFRRLDGVLFPPVNPEFCGGYDPIRYKTDNTVSKNLSQACGVIYKKFDYFNSGESNQYAALYLDRPDDARIAHREMVKACKYYAARLMIERQIETTETEFENANMIPFLMKSVEDDKIGIWTNQKRTENSLQKLVTRFSAPKHPSEPDHVERYPFEIGLEDKRNFNLANTLTSHITMAEIMLEEGLDQLIFTNLTDNSTRKMVNVMNEIFPPVNK